MMTMRGLIPSAAVQCINPTIVSSSPGKATYKLISFNPHQKSLCEPTLIILPTDQGGDCNSKKEKKKKKRKQY